MKSYRLTNTTLNKYRRLIMLLGILLCMHSQAQKFTGGFFVGLSASQVEGDAIWGFDLPGANIGAYTALPLSDRMDLQMELAFVQKGSRSKPNDTLIDLFKLRLNYLEVPLLINYRLGKLSFELGPALDILVSVKQSDSYGHLSNTEDFNPPFNTFSLAGILGVNYHFSDRWHASFRTNNSITAIRPGTTTGNDPQGFYRPGRSLRNIILTFGVYFDFGKS